MVCMLQQVLQHKNTTIQTDIGVRVQPMPTPTNDVSTLPHI